MRLARKIGIEEAQPWTLLCWLHYLLTNTMTLGEGQGLEAEAMMFVLVLSLIHI